MILLQLCVRLKGTLSVQFEFDRDPTTLKNDRQINLSNRQSANRVKYLPVTSEIKCNVRSIAVELNVEGARALRTID